MQILKHGREAAPQIVTGSLLGLDIGSTMEVTHSFPFPVSEMNFASKTSFGK